MSWIGPASKQGLKLAAKYGPHVKAAWDIGGDKVKEVTRNKTEEIANRNKAFKDAESRVDGSVLSVTHKGRPVFVVLAGDEAVEAYPETGEPLTALIDKVDLAKRVTPAERRERLVRTRVSRAGGRAVERGRGALGRGGRGH